MTKACTPTAAAPSACGGCRSSTCPAVTSRSPTTTARWWWCATARSTTTASCAASCRAWATPSAPSRTARWCCTATRSGARRSSSGSTACSASRSGTHASRRLLVGRDRLGIKPIYWLQDGRRVAFASEAKALLELDGVPREIDANALASYLELGYVPAPLSMLRGIRKLPIASMLEVSPSGVQVHTYWQPSTTVDERVTPQEWVAARARASRRVGAHADGERRADRRVPLRRRRLERRAGADDAPQQRAGEDLFDRLRWRRGRTLLQRARSGARSGAPVQDRPPRDPGQARCGAAAAQAAVAHG